MESAALPAGSDPPVAEAAEAALSGELELRAVLVSGQEAELRAWDGR